MEGSERVVALVVELGKEVVLVEVLGKVVVLEVDLVVVLAKVEV